MTGTGEAAPVPDPEATGVLPAYADNASTHVFPRYGLTRPEASATR